MNVASANTRLSRTPRRRHRGAALLVCLFVTMLTSLFLVAMLDVQTQSFSAMRNSSDYERALYLAGAGVHHALAELEADFGWRDGISATELPSGSGNMYTATVTDNGDNTLTITGTGITPTVTRRVEVVVGAGA